MSRCRPVGRCTAAPCRSINPRQSCRCHCRRLPPPPPAPVPARRRAHSPPWAPGAELRPMMSTPGGRRRGRARPCWGCRAGRAASHPPPRRPPTPRAIPSLAAKAVPLPCARPCCRAGTTPTIGSSSSRRTWEPSWGASSSVSELAGLPSGRLRVARGAPAAMHIKRVALGQARLHALTCPHRRPSSPCSVQHKHHARLPGQREAGLGRAGRDALGWAGHLNAAGPAPWLLSAQQAARQQASPAPHTLTPYTPPRPHR